MNSHFQWWIQTVVSLILGIAIGLFVAKDHRPPGPPFGHCMQESDKPTCITAFFSKELALNPTQKTKVHDVLARHDAEMTKIHSECHPRFEAVKNSVDSEIETLLNADQQKKFSELRRQMEEHRPPGR